MSDAARLDGHGLAHDGAAAGENLQLGHGAAAGGHGGSRGGGRHGTEPGSSGLHHEGAHGLGLAQNRVHGGWLWRPNSAPLLAACVCRVSTSTDVNGGGGAGDSVFRGQGGAKATDQRRDPSSAQVRNALAQQDGREKVNCRFCGGKGEKRRRDFKSHEAGEPAKKCLCLTCRRLLQRSTNCGSALSQLGVSASGLFNERLAISVGLNPRFPIGQDVQSGPHGDQVMVTFSATLRSRDPAVSGTSRTRRPWDPWALTASFSACLGPCRIRLVQQKHRLTHGGGHSKRMASGTSFLSLLADHR